MKINKSLVPLSVLCLGLGSGEPWLHAQDSNQVDQLKQQLQQMQENFEKVQREQRQQIEALTKKLDDLTKQQAAEAERKKLEQELTAQLSSNQPPATAQSTAAPEASL